VAATLPCGQVDRRPASLPGNVSTARPKPAGNKLRLRATAIGHDEGGGWVVYGATRLGRSCSQILLRVPAQGDRSRSARRARARDTRPSGASPITFLQPCPALPYGEPCLRRSRPCHTLSPCVARARSAPTCPSRTVRRSTASTLPPWARWSIRSRRSFHELRIADRFQTGAERRPLDTQPLRLSIALMVFF
jgi:hypothetical protein